MTTPQLCHHAGGIMHFGSRFSPTACTRCRWCAVLAPDVRRAHGPGDNCDVPQGMDAAGRPRAGEEPTTWQQASEAAGDGGGDGNNDSISVHHLSFGGRRGGPARLLLPR